MNATLTTGKIDMFVIIMSLMVAVGLIASASAAPVIDGRLDPAEGYTDGHWVILNVEGSGGVNADTIPSPNGQLWTYQNANGDLYVNYELPVTLVDNTYGDNSIGWGQDALSGKNHNFTDLVNSDAAEFQIYNVDGAMILDFVLDYLSATPTTDSGYASLGSEGGEGGIVVGSTGDILAWATSLDYNFNKLGYVLTSDSPATDATYTENPDFPGWQFTVNYEFLISGEAFGDSGYGTMQIPVTHISPNKIGKNRVYDEIDGSIPEPATIMLLGLGAAMLRRRNSL